MSVTVETLTTDVVAEPERTPERPQASQHWQDRERVESILRRVRRDRERTAARGYDD